MRQIIFMLLCFCCMSMKAQNHSADTSVKTNSVINQNQPQEDTDTLRISAIQRCFLIESLEEEYDVIYRDINPRFILASRGIKYYKVDIFTGEETEICHKKTEDNLSLSYNYYARKYESEEDDE